jgi:lipopolysaccharide export system protein LptA
MKQLQIFFCILFIFLFCCFNKAAPQKPAVATQHDSLKSVEILPGVKRLEFRKIDSLTELQILSGNVRLKQGKTIFSCDSCVINNRMKTFDAFGHVHINDTDTTHIYSDYLRYLTDKRLAYFKQHVRLTDGHGVLTTEELEYDVNTKIGIYKNGGKVINKNTVLTSQEGYYYTDLKDVYFKNHVELKDPAYYIKADSLLYNTLTETTRFIAETFIRDSSGRTIETREGFYNVKTRKAEFGQRPVIHDGKLFVTGNDIASDDSTGIVQIRSNGLVVDTVQGYSVLANEIFYNKKTDAILATKKPLMIVKQDQDSIYITADTLFSARLTDLYGKKDSVFTDTLKGIKVINTNEKDSTNRYFEAFRNVKIFSDSIQSVCDSMFYSFHDSVFRLYQHPVVWSNENQITGDTILLYTKNKKADKIQVYNNSFLVNQLQPGVFDQIKATRMDGFFKDGAIDSIRARGMAESIYYIQDEDSAFTGINQAQSDILDIYFSNKELQRVVFRSAVKGTMWPISEKKPGEMKLPNFQWFENRRPKTKFELFE